MADVQERKLIDKFFQLPVDHIIRLKKEINKNGKKETALDRIPNQTPSASAFDTEMEICQWIEYCALYAVPGSLEKDISHQLLLDINKFLLVHSYLVGYTFTLADLALYYTIHDKMMSLSAVEKELYINLSRWFKHIQQLISTSGNNSMKFSTLFSI